MTHLARLGVGINHEFSIEDDVRVQRIHPILMGKDESLLHKELLLPVDL